jgi:transposase, IS5 family
VLRRIDQVLEQLPKARQQARQRIISEQTVENEDKILSLYEREVRVIVRKKAGKDVEFGNTLLLGENPQGLILDWELFKETAPADSRLQERSRERMKDAFGSVLKNLGADRGFDSEANQKALAAEGIYNGVCPRSPHELKERGHSWKFKKLQRRRGQTEGRVAIVKNVFLGRPLRSKGFEHRALAVTWTVLTHNLWVMARLTIAAREAARTAQKAAA